MWLCFPCTCLHPKEDIASQEWQNIGSNISGRWNSSAWEDSPRQRKLILNLLYFKPAIPNHGKGFWSKLWGQI